MTPWPYIPTLRREPAEAAALMCAIMASTPALIADRAANEVALALDLSHQETLAVACAHDMANERLGAEDGGALLVEIWALAEAIIRTDRHFMSKAARRRHAAYVQRRTARR